MKIIDSHSHVFNVLAGFGAKGELRSSGAGKAMWADGTEIDMIPEGYGEDNFSIESLLSIMDANDVEKAVLLQGGFYGFQNQYVVKAIKEHPTRFTGAFTFDPFCKNADSIAKKYLDDENFKIVKFELSTGAGLMSYREKFEIDNDRMIHFYDMIASHGATLVLDIGSPGMESFQVEAVKRIATKYKEMNIVICHLLAPTLNDEEDLKRALTTLKLDNVYFDLSAIPWNVYPEQYPYVTGQKYYSLAKEIVGNKKLLWGSDAPSPLTRDTYEHLWDYLKNVCSDDELQEIMYSNSQKVYFS